MYWRIVVNWMIAANAIGCATGFHGTPASGLNFELVHDMRAQEFILAIPVPTDKSLYRNSLLGIAVKEVFVDGVPLEGRVIRRYPNDFSAATFKPEASTFVYVLKARKRDALGDVWVLTTAILGGDEDFELCDYAIPTNAARIEVEFDVRLPSSAPISGSCLSKRVG